MAKMTPSSELMACATYTACLQEQAWALLVALLEQVRKLGWS